MSAIALVFYVLLSALMYACISGVIAALISEWRGRGRDSGFMWGFFLGVIGIVVVTMGRSGVRMPDAPDGLKGMRCYTCNAVQNVDLDDSSFMCWQCDSPTILRATVVAEDPEKITAACPSCDKPIKMARGVVSFYCPHCADRVNTPL